MWFRQLSIFRLPAPDQIDADKLADALRARPFQRCSGLDWFSEGWTPPASHLDEPLFRQAERLLLSLRREDKVLPAGVIRDQLDGKLAEIEQQELRKVGRKEKLALKEQITDDLLPRAFTRSSRSVAYFDLPRGWLLVDSASASKAENLLSSVREAMPPLPASLPRTAMSPHALMTDWLAAGEADGDFVLDSDCELKDGSENGGVIRCTRMDLTAEEIRQHLATGKQVTRLGLIWRERIRFTLTDTLQLKKLQFLDVLQEEASQAGDDAPSLFEATFMLVSEELGELVDDLVQALGGLQDSDSVPVIASAPESVASVKAVAESRVDVPWD